jgi:hypothetical protein
MMNLNIVLKWEEQDGFKPPSLNNNAHPLKPIDLGGPPIIMPTLSNP